MHAGFHFPSLLLLLLLLHFQGHFSHKKQRSAILKVCAAWAGQVYQVVGLVGFPASFV